MSEDIARINAKIDAQVKTSAQIKALQRGLHLQEAIELLLKAWVEGGVEIVDDGSGKGLPTNRETAGAGERVPALA